MRNYIEKIKNELIKSFNNDYSGHDFEHLERVMNMALFLQKFEGGNKKIIAISAYLHDVHRLMQNETGQYVEPRESLNKIVEILNKVDLSKKEVKEICFCVENHENYNWNGNNDIKNKNAMILQDADNLDALGAIGIARTFAYGGNHNIPMYIENSETKNFSNYNEKDNVNETTIEHFYHKLFNLCENMNTKTAKQIADARTKFMRKYVDKFLLEWKFK